MQYMIQLTEDIRIKIHYPYRVVYRYNENDLEWKILRLAESMHKAQRIIDKHKRLGEVQ